MGGGRVGMRGRPSAARAAARPTPLDAAHPHGVRPVGNAYLLADPAAQAAAQRMRNNGLGTLARLPDELLLELLGRLRPVDLARLAQTSRALYAFAMHDELWRALTLRHLAAPSTAATAARAATVAPVTAMAGIGSAATIAACDAGGSADGGDARRTLVTMAGPWPARADADGSDEGDRVAGHFQFVKTWRDTFVRLHVADTAQSGRRHGRHDHGNRSRRRRCGGCCADDCTCTGTAAASGDVHGRFDHRPVRLGRGLYSDALFGPWMCATLALDRRWQAVSNIDRRSARCMTPDDFVRDYERPGKPVIITDLMTEWPCFTRWSRDYLVRACEDKRMAAGLISMPLAAYFHYCDQAREESPLYVFDKAFAAKAPLLARDYTVPMYFAEDLFGLLGGDAERPDYRWLIIGPPRSGSSWHQDPNGTSAWNACIRGRKKWVLYPPAQTPPGVFPSADRSEVTAPVSVIEWFVHFYAAAHDAGRRAPLEAVCEPVRRPRRLFPWRCGHLTHRQGELLFVPSGWWHTVLNLTESVALTQNYVGSCNLRRVMSFLRGRPEQVSGCADGVHLYDRFDAALRRARPDLIAMLERDETAESATRPATDRHPAAGAPRSFWAALRPNNGTDGATAAAVVPFTFAFGAVGAD